MSKIIEVTNLDENQKLWLNVNHVVTAWPQSDGMYIVLSGGEDILLNQSDWARVKEKLWQDEDEV